MAVMLATVVDIGNSVGELEKGVLGGAKDRRTYNRKNRYRTRVD